MNKTSKAPKVQVIDVKIGDAVRGNLIPGTHVVAAIRTGAAHLKNTSTQYTFVNADGAEFFIGRVNAKATLA